MANMVKITCVQCGKVFLRAWGEVNRKRKAKTGPFCGKGCRNVYHCKGKKLSKAHRAKLMGRRPWNKGKPWPKAMKAKLSELASGGVRAMEKNGHWRGGRSVKRDGYIEIRLNGKRKLEHVYMMEQHLGRRMTRGEVVHHMNGNRQDNRLANLRVMTISEHMRLHNTGKKYTKRQVAFAPGVVKQ